MAETRQNQNLFLWKGPCIQLNDKAHYQAFELNGVHFAIGDCVYLFPEDENSSHYIGRLVSAYTDNQSADPLCIEVKWYERRTNFEPNTRGIEESEREVFELEDTDVNQIGCISGKVDVVRSRSYEDAYALMHGKTSDWYFCRGYFMQASNSFQYYTDAELAMHGAPVRASSPPAALPEPKGSAMLEDDDTPTPAPSGRNSNPSRQRNSARGGGICLECGATETPQWREGPEGPRTLCNACGLRIVRAAARKNKGQGGGGGGGGRGSQGGGSRSAPGSSRKGHSNKARAANAAEQLPFDDAAAALLSWSGANGVEEDAQARSMRPSRQAAKLSAQRTAEFARTGTFPEGELQEADGKRGRKRSLPQAGAGLVVDEEMMGKCNEVMMGLATGGMFGGTGAAGGEAGFNLLQALAEYPFAGGSAAAAPGAPGAQFPGLPDLPTFLAGDFAAAAAAAAASLGSGASLEAATAAMGVSGPQPRPLAGPAAPSLPAGGFGALLGSAASVPAGASEGMQGGGRAAGPAEEEMAAAAAAAAAAAIQSMNGLQQSQAQLGQPEQGRGDTGLKAELLELQGSGQVMQQGQQEGKQALEGQHQPAQSPLQQQQQQQGEQQQQQQGEQQQQHGEQQQQQGEQQQQQHTDQPAPQGQGLEGATQAQVPVLQEPLPQQPAEQPASLLPKQETQQPQQETQLRSLVAEVDGQQQVKRQRTDAGVGKELPSSSQVQSVLPMAL